MYTFTTAADEQFDELNAKIEEMRPKAIFADAIAASDRTMLIGELAKLLSQNGVDIDQAGLFSWMYSNGYLVKDGPARNMPTEMAAGAGLLKVRERLVSQDNGSLAITRTTLVTGRGQVFFVNQFLTDEPEYEEEYEENQEDGAQYAPV